MKINESYLHLFKKSYNSYLYQLEKGSYLCFSKNLKYNGIVCFYTPKTYDYLEEIANKKLNILFNRGILELV